MNKKELLLLSALAFNCQNEEPPPSENITIPNLPKIEVTLPEVKEPQKLEEKVQPKGDLCTIDLSDRFIPELLSLSRDAQEYFTTTGILQNPFQRERLGIFSSFKHHKEPFEHYAKAIERRGDQEQPKIELKFVPYTTTKTLQKIAVLEKQLEDIALNPKLAEQRKVELETLRTQVQTVKNVQQILHWEGFYKGELNGVHDTKTGGAVIKYQKYHRNRLINPVMSIDGTLYELKDDGRINKPTRELLNKDFEEYAFGGVRRVLEERVFHAECDNRNPYVIEQGELNKLVDSAAEQLHLDSVEGVRNFLSAEHQTATVYLEILERYTKEFMKIEIDVEKWDSGRWEKIRTKTNLRLYVIEDGKKIELFHTKAVVGGWVKNKKTGKKKQYKTPEREFYLKHVTVLPHWNPPEWAAAEEEVKNEKKLPGPFNAFGMLNTPLYYDNKPQEDPFRSWQEGDNGYRIHLTPWPSSVENGGASHGCIRIHPNMSRFFYFVTGYTPHQMILEKDKNGKETLKFTPLKGSYIPFEPGHYIKVRTCKEKCE